MDRDNGLQLRSSRQYILFHKPYDVLSQFTPDVPGQQTLADYGFPAEVYAAGRLDKDSEGLLLLTDDGPFIKRILDPKFGHERTYLAQVEGIPTADALAKFRKGLIIGAEKTLPAEVTLLLEPPELPERSVPIRVRKSIPTSWLEVKLIEGKNRQVRRMTSAIGFPTLRLLRIAIGKLSLGNLEPGKWRNLTPEEQQIVKAL